MSPQALIAPFFDSVTNTISHVVYDRPGGHAALIDTVLDYDPKSGRTSTHNAQKLVDFVKAHDLTVAWLLETHAHADHLSAAHWLRDQLGGKIGIGAHIREVQSIFGNVFHLEPGFKTDGSQFDHLFHDNDTFQIGSLTGRALWVPGHTPADLAYQIGDDVFVGDTLFMPDVGTARCDFPGGSAATLYQSIQRLLALPPDTRLHLCHDYPPNGRAVAYHTTVAAERAANIHVRDGIREADFITLRETRDRTLDMPVLILPAVQINIRAGELPPAEENGTRYLKIPLDAL